MHCKTSSVFLLAGFLSHTIATPIRPGATLLERSLVERANGVRIPKLIDCDKGQTEEIEETMNDVAQLSTFGEGLSRTKEDYQSNKGYQHYFKNEDAERVHAGFDALMRFSSEALDTKTKVNFRCAKTQQDPWCSKDSLAVTNGTPEDLEAPDATPKLTKGTREIVFCPAFFTTAQTKRHLPRPGKTKDIEKFCENKESKKLGDFLSGGHTLLHELTHLDTFGIDAGYPALDIPADDKSKTPAYKSHGTVDWKGNSTPGNARILRNSKAKDKPERWQNAESFAATATEALVMSSAYCDIKEINL